MNIRKDITICQLSSENEEHRMYLKEYIPDFLLNRSNTIIFGAVHNIEGLIGAVIAEISDFTVEIEYINVHENFQRQKIGTALISEVLKLLDSTTTPYIAVSFIPDDILHFEVIEFYRSLGIFIMTELNNRYYVSASFIRTDSQIQKLVQKNYSIKAISLEEFSKSRDSAPKLTDFVKLQQKADNHQCDELIIKDFGILSPVHSFIIEANNRIAAVLLSRFTKDYLLEISFIYTEKDNIEQIGAIFKGFYNSIEGKELDVIFTTLSKARKELASHFFEQPIESTIQAVWNGLLPDDLDNI